MPLEAAVTRPPRVLSSPLRTRPGSRPRRGGGPDQRRRTAGIVVAAVVTVVAVVTATAQDSRAAGYQSRDAALRREVGRLMADPRVSASSARVGVTVQDASTRVPVYVRYANTPLMPASTQKVFTAAAAMNVLGSGYRWNTDVLAPKAPSAGVVSRLYLRGRGDPTLMEKDLTALAAALRSKGVTRVAGDVVGDATYFDEQRYSPYWSSAYASDYYAAQVSGLTLAPDTDYDAGTVIVNVTPSGTAGARPRLTLTPPSAARTVTLVNQVSTGTKGSATTLSLTRRSGTNVVTVSGRVAVGRSTVRKWVTVNEPAILAARAFRDRLVAAGIRVDGTAVKGRTPTGQTLLARHASMTLAQLLVPFLKLSNNSHGEAIVKTLGARTGRPGSWADGTAAVRAFAARVGIDVRGLRFVDGSGLARANRLTPNQLAALLDKVQRTSWAGTFRAALPIAGRDPVRWSGGTLASRMKGTAAAGNLSAKNGSLTGVSTLAGYVTGADGRRYVFVMMGNYGGSSTRPVEDRLGVLLAGWRMTNR